MARDRLMVLKGTDLVQSWWAEIETARLNNQSQAQEISSVDNRVTVPEKSAGNSTDQRLKPKTKPKTKTNGETASVECRLVPRVVGRCFFKAAFHHHG